MSIEIGMNRSIASVFNNLDHRFKNPSVYKFKGISYVYELKKKNHIHYFPQHSGLLQGTGF